MCGTPRDAFFKVADALLANAGPDRTGAMCYAARLDPAHDRRADDPRRGDAAALARQHRPARRRHPGPARPCHHSGLHRHRHAVQPPARLPERPQRPAAARHAAATTSRPRPAPSSWWSNFPKYIVSQLKAWYGDAATAENDFAYDFLPKNIGDHSHIPMFVAMHEGIIKGFMAIGQNPAGSGQHSIFHRQALGKLDWMVVRDLYETETATFWKNSPEVTSGKIKPQDIQTEVILLPAAAVAETDGSFTNTQRVLQWHEKAADPPGDARSDIWFTYHLGRRLKKLYADSKENRDRPIQALVWDYLDEKANAGVEDQGRAVGGAHPEGDQRLTTRPAQSKGKPVVSFVDLKDDGSTACGAWIYSGVFGPTTEHPEGVNRAANRQGDDWVSLGWGWSWPVNRRILYNRCSADPQGRPVGQGSSAGATSLPGHRRPGGRAVTSTGTPASQKVGRPRRARLPCRPSRPTRRPRPTASASKRTTAPLPSS